MKQQPSAPGASRSRQVVNLLLALAVVAVPFLAACNQAAADQEESIWGTSAPTRLVATDKSAVTVGTRFQSTVAGTVTAVRVYRPTSSTQSVGYLWDSSGKQLAQVQFPAAGTAGWLEARLNQPVALSPNTDYIAGYRASNGSYAYEYNTLGQGKSKVSGSLRALRGVYTYGSGSPQSTYRDSAYFVDIKFLKSTSSAPTTPPPATPTVRPTTTPTAAPTTQPPTVTPTQQPGPARCVGAANTPGGPDPWGGCWPGAQNTGYPKGLPGDARTPVTLTPYTGSLTIRSCGVVIDSKIVNGGLVIQAGNGTTSKNTPCVTIRNSLVKGVIFSESKKDGPVLIEDTEVAPPDLPFWENIGRSNFFAYRVNSHGGEGVIKCESNCEAKDNWIHGMELGGSYHYNALGGNGTDNFRIEHNYASCGDWAKVSSRTSDAGCSAVIGFYGDYAPIKNIDIRRNFLASTFDTSSSGLHTQAGYCLNPGYYPGKPYPTPSNVSVTENVFARGGSGKCGVYGPTNSLNKRGAQNGSTWSDNRYEDGAPISRIEE